MKMKINMRGHAKWENMINEREYIYVGDNNNLNLTVIAPFSSITA